MLLGLVALGLGCASEVGWAPTQATTCAPEAPARVCSLAAPDFGHTLALGDTELIPGECAALDEDGRGGLVRVETRDPRGEARRRWIRAPSGKLTILEIRADGRAKLAERRRCDGAPVTTTP